MKTRYIFGFITVCFSLFSCRENEEEQKVSDVTGEELTSISIRREPRKEAEGINDTNEPGYVAPIINEEFTEKSRIFISQMGPTNLTDPNFTNSASDARPYLYIYDYNGNTEADWDNEYNFSPIEDRDPIKWMTVKNIGSVGNAFSFYAMYCPESDGETVIFSVLADQTGGETNPYDTGNFLKSDIMGAYHSTSSLFTRLRFRLYHLMVYLKVTLFVPVYEDIAADPENGIEAGYSGFQPDKFRGAYVINAATDFSIEWRANRSSDTDAPLTQPGNTKQNIKMYQYEFNETADKIENFNVKDYYTGGNIETTDVWVYNFSVLFPAQSFGNNFLCFGFEDVDNSMKYYYFSAPYIIGDSGKFQLEQGTLQQLYLYLPRKSNETVLVGAKILPWGNSSTDMTVFDQSDTFKEEFEEE